MKLKISVVIALALTLMPSMSFAEIPSGKTFLYVGKINEGSERETSNYINMASLRKKGKLLHYVNWAVWKNEQHSEISESWQYSKEEYAADCDNWATSRFNYSSVTKDGRILDKFKEPFKLETPAPNTVEDKMLEAICK